MPRRIRPPMFAIAAALLGLIALLATLQYRWLGQISDAERARMTANVNTRAAAFAQDFDREVTRAYLLFQLEADPPADERPAAAVASRYDRWQATARFPRMIKEIYLVPSDGEREASALRRFDPATRFLEPAAWPGALSPVRATLAHAETTTPMPEPPSRTVLYRAMTPSIWPAVPALVIPAPIVMFDHGAGPADLSMAPQLRHTILLLDRDYITRDMLPALAQQYFRGTGDGFDYQLAVVSTDGGTSLYHSAADFTSAGGTKADASVDLFKVSVQDFPALAAEVSRFAFFASTTAVGGRGVPGKQTIVRGRIGGGGDAGMAMTPTAPFSIILQGSKTSPSADKLDKLIAGSTSAALSAVGARLSAPAGAHWRLLVKHPSGSLEQAVNAARRRNLAISTGILGVLGVSVGFLVVSTRRAHALARRQLEFVATVSHELRTPLAVIRSAADNLADGIVHDDPRIKQYGELVRREGLRLTDLVEQILEFAGLQSGQHRLTRRPVEIDALLRDVAAALEPSARAAGAAVELEIAERLPPVLGDEAALRRVFQNLIGNSLKYGATAGWVGVTAGASAAGVEVTVADRGIGIAPADQSRVFDPFYRTADVVAAQIQGAGLGLSLVKRIVEAHGGRVTVKSAPGQGSAFTVMLPVASGDPSEGPVGAAATQPS
ncbi:MAG TPA: HAMP domain-containing sensor histidine kinase [Vicinamibacterales bacterium]|nr:HAMP domain-containing sensor histidine kinase [Vicinamibacterales bacterium]